MKSKFEQAAHEYADNEYLISPEFNVAINAFIAGIDYANLLHDWQDISELNKEYIECFAVFKNDDGFLFGFYIFDTEIEYFKLNYNSFKIIG